MFEGMDGARGQREKMLKLMLVHHHKDWLTLSQTTLFLLRVICLFESTSLPSYCFQCGIYDPLHRIQ